MGGCSLRQTPIEHLSDVQMVIARLDAREDSDESLLSHGNNPRVRFASWTRLIPRLKAARRMETFCLRLRLSVCVKAPSRMRNSLSTTSVSVQKKLCRSCTHSK